MVLVQTKVPGLSGWKEGYELGESFNIRNGDVLCEITFCITPDAIKNWSNLNLKSPNQPIEILLAEFNKQNFEKYKAFLLRALNGFIEHYGGFPLQTILTRKLWFCFDEGGHSAISMRSEDFKEVGISFNINDISQMTPSQIVGTIKHELLHIVSKAHQGEMNTIRGINVLHNQFRKHNDETKIKIDAGVNELLAYCKENSTLSQHFSGHIKNKIDLTYEYFTNIFWNLISDSALCVIAIEMDDMEYIKTSVETDSYRINDLPYQLDQNTVVIKHAAENVLDEQRKFFLLTTLKSLQFIICLDSMPYHAIAYGILGDDWRPKKKISFGNLLKIRHKNGANKNIENFKGIVLKHCDPDVAAGFLKFYDDFLDIIKAQAIHNDPLNPNIIQQIHNTECLRRGKKAYRTLIAEFNKLSKELKVNT